MQTTVLDVPSAFTLLGLDDSEYASLVTLGASPLLSGEFFIDPYPTYRQLRAMGDVVWSDEINGWLVLDLDNCRQVLSDHERFSSARAGAMLEAMVPGFRFEELLPRIVCDSLEQDFLFLDPPRHTPIRRELAMALRAAITGIEPDLQELARGLVRGLEGSSRCDLMVDFAGRIPASTMGLLLGLSPAQAEQWQQWTYEAGPLFGASPALADDARRRRMLDCVEALNESMAELLFLTEVRTPLLDRLRELVTTRTWTPEEALGAVVQLYAAGVLTTGDALVMGLLALLEHPAQHALVESGEASLDQAIEEIVRFTSPTQVMHRLVRVDTELGGRSLQRGDLVYAVIGAANRDPRVFVDPDRFDVRRPDVGKHIGFGVGVHGCIGGALAKLELRAALTAIVPRLRRWRIDGPLCYRDYSLCFRGLHTLPVAARSSVARSTGMSLARAGGSTA